MLQRLIFVKKKKNTQNDSREIMSVYCSAVLCHLWMGTWMQESTLQREEGKKKNTTLIVCFKACVVEDEQSNRWRSSSFLFLRRFKLPNPYLEIRAWSRDRFHLDRTVLKWDEWFHAMLCCPLVASIGSAPFFFEEGVNFTENNFLHCTLSSGCMKSHPPDPDCAVGRPLFVS